MFIRNCLTPMKELDLLQTNQSVQEAILMFKQDHLESLPVVDETGNFKGICSYATVFKHLLKNEKQLTDLIDIQVGDCLDDRVTALSLEDIFELTLPIIVRYPFVPIIDEGGKFLGIVKRGDIEKGLESVFALNVPGIRLLIASLEVPGEFEKIVETIDKYGVNLIAALSFDAGDRYARRIMVKVDYNEHMEEIIDVLEHKGFNILAVHQL